jgi:lipoyl(octanoyl) transferase
MRELTEARGPSTPDELWLLEHPPVYTLGQAGRREHVRAPGRIEVVASDRGGQVTYHGPGQLVAYLLLDLRRAGLGVRGLVTLLEDAVVALLHEHGVAGEGRRDAPGVYVQGAKVAALGLRVRRGCCYHGLALNVDMDLEPFARIDPCGYRGLPVTQLRDLGLGLSVDEAGAQLAGLLARALGLALLPAPAGEGEGAPDAYTS